MTRLDEFAPAWQFHEVHRIHVHAPAHRVYHAIQAVTAGEIRFFRALTWLRRLGRPGPTSILNASPDVPILEVARRSGFLLLAASPPDPPSTAWRGGTKGETDPRTRRRFRGYWTLIYPGSSLIRRMWLRAIKRRAEA